MRTVQLLRKLDPAEWGGTESAVAGLLHTLHNDGVSSVVYCPRLQKSTTVAPPKLNGCALRHFRACVPIWGLNEHQKRQYIAVGGNIFSFDLLPALWREKDAALIHSHTLGRLGAIAATVAQRRRIPFVVTIHGGFLDLPQRLERQLKDERGPGFDWGRAFGFLLKSRAMLERADAILTCNPTEAARLRDKFPNKTIRVQPHGISVGPFQVNSRAAALNAWPQLRGRKILLSVGRIDPVKNQQWLVAQAPRLFEKHPDAMLVLVGPCTDQAYGEALRRNIAEFGLEQRVLCTGSLEPGDPRLIGLFQIAEAVVLPSISETFGLVLLEAWAAGTTVVASGTSGARALVRHGENGWLFNLDEPATFHEAARMVLTNSQARANAAAAGQRMTLERYDLAVIGRGVRKLYEELVEAKACAT